MKKIQFLTLIVLLGGLILMANYARAVADNTPGREGQTQNPVTYPVKVPESKTLELAKQSLENLVEQFQNENENAFFSNVSDRYLREYLDFQNNVDSDFRAFDLIRISYWIDDTEEENERINLSIHWEKSTQSPTSGTPVLTRGKTKLIFEITDGKAYLVDQTGDTLFGVTMMR